jgi:hypothetical protein
MRFSEERHRSRERARAAQQDELRAPAAARRRATGLDERGKKLVAHEWLLAGKRVPLLRIHARQ